MTALPATKFVRLALPGAAGAAARRATAAFHRTLRDVAALPCSAEVNPTVDSMPGSRFRPCDCPCSAPGPPATPGRLHTFWDCPAAVAVRGALADALGAPLPGPASLWLLDPPAPWRLVALCALSAMEYGRCHLWTAHYAGEPVDARASGQAAVGRFWLLLDDFATAYPRSLDGWDVGPDTPFLYLDDGLLTVRLPPA